MMTEFWQQGQQVQYQYNAETINYYAAATPAPQVPPVLLAARAQPFVGREQELAWIHNQLETASQTVGRTIGICGPGGMGKTALVTEALAQLVSHPSFSSWYPDGIFYHSFYVSPSLEVMGEHLARLFNEDPTNDPFGVAKRLLSRKQTLLVFDGVEVLTETHTLCELGGRNTVLLLSRRRTDVPDAAYRLDLALLPQAQGQTLLQTVAGSRAVNQESITRLVQAVGGYPLALHLIGRYLDIYEENLTEYLHHFEKDQANALAHPELHQGERQHLSVQVILQHTYHSLPPQQQQMLAVIGLLAPAPFPLELVQSILDQSARDIHQALGGLINLSLVRRPANEYEVSHPLIHTFAANLLASSSSTIPADTRNVWRSRWLETLTTYFEASSLYDAPFLTLWLPQVMPLLWLQDLSTSQWFLGVKLLERAGVHAYDLGHYTQAELVLKKALAVCLRVDPEHPHTAAAMNNLAVLYAMQGRYAEAEPLHQAALEIREQQLGSHHVDTATSLNNLATLHQKRGRYAQAESLFQRALAIREQLLGSEHTDTLAIINNLAALYRAQGRYAEAEPLYQRALTIREHLLDPDHPDTAMSLHNLAELYAHQGRNAQAEPLYQRALTIREHRLGPDHPFTATTINNLAVLYTKQEHYVEAEPLLQRALAIREQQLGPHHPETANSLHNLAELYAVQGRYTQAEPLYRQALTIRENSLDPQHPDIARSISSLAALYIAQGQHDQGVPLLQRSLAIYEHHLGAEDPSTQTIRTLLAQSMFQSGTTPQAPIRSTPAATRFHHPRKKKQKKKR